ncbi:YiiX/YebB-like N1pC/P60 family cysteine hydrolase [Escherichia coli]|uniref:YiiX/YebB-like N1pC/P60 family cysteine hydrolase n=1 Tax=Escherichia coli TaxID=562 RepID=UPI001C4042D7|nr:YiiX/YebB-like N1pC/P60 family cysteine hydrolase [Escherichia coli]
MVALIGTAYSLPGIAAFALPPSCQNGDLVFREGDEAISAVIRTIDNSGFSHVGMFYTYNGKQLIIHATPGENNTPGGVITEPLKTFVENARNGNVSCYKVNATAIQRHQAISHALNRLGEPFSVQPGKGFYCTELVWYAWKYAGIDISPEKTTITLPFLSGNMILPQNILSSAATYPAK